MFLYSKWDYICQELSRYHTIRADEITSQDPHASWIVIKHDVETDVAKALEMARIEHRYAIRATYYIQADLLEKNHLLLQEIQSLGHEIAYHYDVLDAQGGDMDAAREEFDLHIASFRAFGFTVATVCPHGNPIIDRDGWHSNKDFFRNPLIAQRYADILDIVVSLPEKLPLPYIYISDAAYGWKKVANIQDNDIRGGEDVSLRSHDDVLALLGGEKRIIISTHPHRWDRSRLRAALKLYRFKVLRYVARKFSSVPALKKIMSRYYFLAKRI